MAKSIKQLLNLIFVLLFTTTKAWAVDVSGTVYVSSLEDYAELTLKGGTILNVDVDKTIKSISRGNDAAPLKDISLGPKGRFPKERTPDGARFPSFSV